MAPPKQIALPVKSTLGTWLKDGGPRALMVFASNPKLAIGITEFQPPGIQGGKPIDVTTQLDVIEVTDPLNGVREMGVQVHYPATEIMITEMSFSCQYDPIVYSELPPVINCPNDYCTAYLPNGGFLLMWAFIESFIPDMFAKAKHPSAKCKVSPSNLDPATQLVQLPVYHPPAARKLAGAK